jgi:hypothetical protein
VRGRLICLMVAVGLLVSLLGLSSTASAQSLPVCAPKTLSSVPISGQARDGEIVACQTRDYPCPREAYECQWSLDGSVRSFPPVIPGIGKVGRQITGGFKVELFGGSADRTTCSATGTGETDHYCSRRLAGKMKPGEIIAAGCAAKAGALTNPFAQRFFNGPTHIEVDLCQLTVTAIFTKPKNCRPPPGSLLTRARAAAASNRCTVTGRPVRPLRNPPRPWPGAKPPPPSGPCDASNEGGGIDVLLRGEFFGQLWASGSVTATGVGIQTESASEGYDYVSAGHFGPWPCGTTVTLTAKPDQGNHFDRWISTDGSCTGSSPTCTLHITNKLLSAEARFAPTTHQITVVNGEPDGFVTGGSGGSGGYINPPIDCGSQPNGPTTYVRTECSSPAQAQRSDTDLTQLYVYPDSPGPGGDTYGIASIDGCDSSVAFKAELPGGGGEYVSGLQCFINLTSDRTVKVEYKDVGR